MARISSNHFTEARIASSFLPDDLTNSTKRARRLLSWAVDAFAPRFSNDMNRVALRKSKMALQNCDVCKGWLTGSKTLDLRPTRT